MRGRRYLVAMAAILVAFSIGLVGFYLFSADKPDGLESVMEENGVEEGEPVWYAPLDYGDSYLGSWLMGIVGFALVLAVFLGFRLVAKGKRERSAK